MCCLLLLRLWHNRLRNSWCQFLSVGFMPLLPWIWCWVKLLLSTDVDAPRLNSRRR